MAAPRLFTPPRAAPGRHRKAFAVDVAEARARGVNIPAGLRTTLYGIGDELDEIERTGENKYLRPQLVARVLDVMRAANMLTGPADDVDTGPWSVISAELSAAMGDRPQP